jgi:fermentation-respiration switch protein FrsA (DUF1100 family)
VSLDDLVERKPDRGGPYIQIEIAQPDGSFKAGEFEELRAGDRFRVTWPVDHYSHGLVLYCEGAAIPAGPSDVPGNWAVMVKRMEKAP